MVKQRDIAEQLPGGYRRARIIKRLNYLTVACIVEIDLQQYVKALKGGNNQHELSTDPSTLGLARKAKCSYCQNYKKRVEDASPVCNQLV